MLDTYFFQNSCFQQWVCSSLDQILWLLLDCVLLYWSDFWQIVNNCILCVAHVHKKLKMLENTQQVSESRTVLVEDRVNVIKDSVQHLQGELSFFLLIRQRDSVGTFCD